MTDMYSDSPNSNSEFPEFPNVSAHIDFTNGSASLGPSPTTRSESGQFSRSSKAARSNSKS